MLTSPPQDAAGKTGSGSLKLETVTLKDCLEVETVTIEAYHGGKTLKASHEATTMIMKHVLK